MYCIADAQFFFFSFAGFFGFRAKKGFPPPELLQSLSKDTMFHIGVLDQFHADAILRQLYSAAPELKHRNGRDAESASSSNHLA